MPLSVCIFVHLSDCLSFCLCLCLCLSISLSVCPSAPSPLPSLSLCARACVGMCARARARVCMYVYEKRRSAISLLENAPSPYEQECSLFLDYHTEYHVWHFAAHCNVYFRDHDFYDIKMICGVRYFYLNIIIRRYPCSDFCCADSSEKKIGKSTSLFSKHVSTLKSQSSNTFRLGFNDRWF